MAALVVRPAEDRDGAAILAIYGQGIATGVATFESSVPSWEAFCASWARILVAVSGDDVAGWVAASSVSSRCVYQGVQECAIYVADEARGCGVGRRLLQAMIADSERRGIWTLQARIMAMNQTSIDLHRACGYRRVGVHEKLGKMSYGPHAACWIDVVLMERRSPQIV